MAAFAGFITIDPKRSIGSIVAQVTLEEVGTDELQITEHPVELGANVTDHAYKRMPEVIIRCGWSNASFKGVVSASKGFAKAVTGGGAFGPDYVSGVYSELLALQESRIPFDISTGKRKYTNMLMRSLAMTTDDKSENALMVTMTCRQVLIVATRAVTLPPKGSLADPQATQQLIPSGDKNVFVGVPAPGGWNPPNG